MTTSGDVVDAVVEAAFPDFEVFLVAIGHELL
jgi:hypothetical protein